MIDTAASSVLSATDGDPLEVLNRHGRAPVLLVCEHAASRIPVALDGLGLAADDRHSHAALDIGARDLAVGLAERLDAPLVAARFSRLVCDLNRPPETPDAMPARTERIAVPGNIGLTAAQRLARAQALYDPFYDALSKRIDAMGGPALITIHSFTPLWFGMPRPLNLGVLMHPESEDLGRALLSAPDLPPMTEANAPYGPADGVLHTLERHALPRALPNAMIEVRNDLLGDPAGVMAWCEILTEMIRHGLDRMDLK